MDKDREVEAVRCPGLSMSLTRAEEEHRDQRLKSGRPGYGASVSGWVAGSNEPMLFLLGCFIDWQDAKLEPLPPVKGGVRDLNETLVTPKPEAVNQ